MARPRVPFQESLISGLVDYWLSLTLCESQCVTSRLCEEQFFPRTPTEAMGLIEFRGTAHAVPCRFRVETRTMFYRTVSLVLIAVFLQSASSVACFGQEQQPQQQTAARIKGVLDRAVANHKTVKVRLKQTRNNQSTLTGTPSEVSDSDSCSQTVRQGQRRS